MLYAPRGIPIPNPNLPSFALYFLLLSKPLLKIPFNRSLQLKGTGGLEIGGCGLLDGNGLPFGPKIVDELLLGFDADVVFPFT